MLKKLKNNIIRILALSGYKIVKLSSSKPIDIRKLGNNPRSLPYYTNTNRQVLINVELEKGRGLEIFPLDQNSNHPFIVAIKKARLASDFKKNLRQILSIYYMSIQPKTASAWLGLENGEVAELDRQPPWLSLLPWENETIEQKRSGREYCAVEDNKEHGSIIQIHDGWRNFGPVSDNVLDVEVNRLHSLVLSIERNGVLRCDDEGGDIGAIVLINDEGDYRWLVEWGGQHRAAAISAMGYSTVPVRVWQVVERKDVEIWPNVQSRLFSKESALKVFDNIFYGHIAESKELKWEQNG